LRKVTREGKSKVAMKYRVRAGLQAREELSVADGECRSPRNPIFRTGRVTASFDGEIMVRPKRSSGSGGGHQSAEICEIA
jgi:hypothetical protein